MIELLLATVIVGLIIALWYCYIIYSRHTRNAILLDTSLQLSATIERKKLLETIMNTTTKALKAKGSSIILLDPDSGELYFEVATGNNADQIKQIRMKPGEGVAGWVALHGEPVLISNAARDPRWSSKVSDASAITTKNMICVPVHSNGALLGVLQVINKKGNQTFTQKDMKLLHAMSAYVAMALENMFLYEALNHSMDSLYQTSAAKHKMESEMKIARDIQNSFLPGKHFIQNNCELAATLLPANEVGGDFYHYFPLDEEHILACLGDVSDKGTPAALFMSAVMIWIKAKAADHQLPEQIISEINKELSSEDSTMFATIFLAILNTKTGQLVYCDAGHCTALLVRDHAVLPLTSKKGLPIGIMQDASYEANSLTLCSGDQLWLYSDGVTEAENAHGQWYGMQRLEEIVQQIQQQSASVQIEQLITHIKHFATNHEQSDDIALMSIHYQ